MLKPRPHLMNLSPYVLPDSPANDDPDILQLAKNECAIPPPDHVLDAARQAASGIRLYPDPAYAALRQAIAEVHGLETDRILCGCGSLELIALLTAAYLDPGDTVVTSRYSYLYFRTAARMAAAEVRLVDEADYTVDVDALLAAVTADTKTVFVANPGNPTGTFVDRDEIVRLRSGLADNVLLILDEAYAEFVEPDQYRPCFDLVAGGNTVVLRTFSKVYGLAGMRVGWGYFPPEIIDVLYRIQNPGAISELSQAAATAAVADQAHVAMVRDQTAAIRRQFVADLAKAGLTALDGPTNFVLVPLDTADQAKDAMAYLKARGIETRAMGGYDLAHCVRITMGPADAMPRVATALAEWKNGGVTS